ncbi:organic hydroperoxide resistance protein [Crassisporium funariophilum]|nr:organic hydroperoxide resistance protein [Crassisporium funariophilum]
MLTTSARRLLTSSLRSKATATNTFNHVHSRTLLTLKDVKYTAQATASGAGRNGNVESNGLKLDLSLPKELGGSGKGQNPEQLFAMGYSGCFLGALQAVAKTMGKEEMAKNAVVHASVHLGSPNDRKGFGISVDIKVEGIDEELLKAGHEFCPYSRALGHGAVVNVSTM